VNVIFHFRISFGCKLLPPERAEQIILIVMKISVIKLGEMGKKKKCEVHLLLKLGYPEQWGKAKEMTKPALKIL
jgi:hypothetical protein